MATYHGIEWAACLKCGYATKDTTTLEIWNDMSDGTCLEAQCDGNVIVWRNTDGTVVITHATEAGTEWLFEQRIEDLDLSV